LNNEVAWVCSKTKNAHTILIGSPQRRDHVKTYCIGVRITLNSVSEKYITVCQRFLAPMHSSPDAPQKFCYKFLKFLPLWQV